MEQKLCSVVAPLLIVVAGGASIALVNWPALILDFRLALLRDASVVAAGAIWVSLGLRGLRRDGVSLKSACVPVAGLFVLIGIGISSFYAMRFYESAADLVGVPDLAQVKGTASEVIADPDSTPEERVWASELRARITFTRTGELLPVLDESGAEHLYRPTDQDRQQRRAEQQLRVLAREGPSAVRIFLGVLGVVLLVSVAVGIGTPLRRAPAV